MSDPTPQNPISDEHLKAFTETRTTGVFMDEWKARVALARELLAARETIAKLPRTADGVPITPGMFLHFGNGGDYVSGFNNQGDRWLVLWDGQENGGLPADECYSTRAAALAPKAGT